MKELIVEVKNVFGNELIYPQQPESVAEAVRKLTGKKTIDQSDLIQLKILGFNIVVKAPALPRVV